MPRAVFNGKVIAESNDAIDYEGNWYFPPSSIDVAFVKKSDHTTYCTYKGHATYYHVTVAGETAENAIWAYKDPKEAAKHIKDYGSFWNGVTVEP